MVEGRGLVVSENEHEVVMELFSGFFFHFPRELRMELAHPLSQEPKGEFWDGEQWRELPKG